MKYQRGTSISGLLIWSFVIIALTVGGMKVTPSLIEYWKISQAVKKVAASSSGASVNDIRMAYSRYAIVEHVDTVGGADLDITKDGNDLVISFSYEKDIHFGSNVRLVINFEGSGRGPK